MEQGMDTFGKWLSREIDQRGWTQSELARRCRVSHVTISRVVTGERNPGQDLCKKIAKALEVPPEVIFRKAGLLPSIEELDDKSASELLTIFKNLDRERRAMLLNLARGFYLPTSE